MLDKVDPSSSPVTDAVARLPRELLLALMSLAAAAIHFAVTGDHIEEHLAIGAFFLVVAWAQALWAGAVVLRPRRWLYVAGVAGNGCFHSSLPVFTLRACTEEVCSSPFFTGSCDTATTMAFFVTARPWIRLPTFSFHTGLAFGFAPASSRPIRAS